MKITPINLNRRSAMLGLAATGSCLLAGWQRGGGPRNASIGPHDSMSRGRRGNVGHHKTCCVAF